MSLMIRPIEQKDRLQWSTLWDGYNEFYDRTGKAALPPEVTKTTWERFFDLSEPVHALVAESDGKLVGFTHYLFHRSTSMIQRNCYLQDLFTAVNARGTGVGAALIQGVYKEAKKAGRGFWFIKSSCSLWGTC
jgi:GNAT superfamily N-acetyltransferase